MGSKCPCKYVGRKARLLLLSTTGHVSGKRHNGFPGLSLTASPDNPTAHATIKLWCRVQMQMRFVPAQGTHHSAYCIVRICTSATGLHYKGQWFWVFSICIELTPQINSKYQLLHTLHICYYIPLYTCKKTNRKWLRNPLLCAAEWRWRRRAISAGAGAST